MIETASSRERFMVVGKLQMSLIQGVIKKNKKRLSSKVSSDVQYIMGWEMSVTNACWFAWDTIFANFLR